MRSITKCDIDIVMDFRLKMTFCRRKRNGYCAALYANKKRGGRREPLKRESKKGRIKFKLESGATPSSTIAL